nr:hypothetical protein [Tanacetum cinerariifolium]
MDKDTTYSVQQINTMFLSVAEIKVIKGESKVFDLLKINVELFAYDTPLGAIFDEFKRLCGINDDLFTYEVGIPMLSNYSGVKQQVDDSNTRELEIYEKNVCYDECERIYVEAVIFIDNRLVRLIDVIMEQSNGKLIHNSIINGPYVRRMIPEPGDINREVPMNETFHVQTDDELTEKELKQIEADDQAIQTILLGSDIRIREKKAKLFNEWERFTSNDGESIESYYHCFLKLMNDLKLNKHFPEKIASNLKFLNNLQPERSRHVTIVHQTKDLHTADYTQLYDFLKYNQNEVDELKAERLAKTQDPLVIQNGSQNPRVQNIGNQNGLIGVQGNANQNLNRNGNLVAAHTEGNVVGHNGNQIRCYNYRGVGYFARNCTVKPMRRNDVYLLTQLLIAQKEEAGIQLQVEEFDLMAAATDLDEIEEVNANCILTANLHQASTSGTQTNKALVYDSNGSAEVHNYENCYDNEMFNMFTQEEQYTELLEPIPESHQVLQNDNNVISKVTSMEQNEETVEQHPANVEETRALYDSLYQNLAIEVEKVNTVNRKLKETNAELTTELARFKNQEKCFEISQEKYDKLERCYQRSVYQEQCLSKKINALHLSSEETLQLAQESRQKMKQLNKEIKPANYTKINHFSEEAAKFVGDFKSLAKEVDESLAKQKALELEIERLLRAVVSVQKDNTRGTSTNTKFAKQSILGKPPKVGVIHALSKPVTANSIPTPQESKVMKNDKVIAPEMFRINPFKTSREEKHVPNNVRASARIKPITVSQPPVFTKKDVNSDSNGLSSIGIDNIKTRRPQPRSNTKNDKVPSASKSSRSKNKGVEVEEHHRF